jgi:hypothetical protein
VTPTRGGELAPVFVLGAPRSGTSLLYKVLCLHRDAAWVSNYHRRVPGLPQVNAVNRLARAVPRARRRVWFGQDSNAYVFGAGRRPLGHRVFPMPVEGETVFTWAGLTEDPALARPAPGRDEAIRSNLRSVVRWGGGRVLVNKRIGHNRRVPLLASAFPAARFVHVVRDGRAVAASLAAVDWWPDLTLWWHGGTPRGWAERGGDPWEVCARHWVQEVEVVSRSLSAVPPAAVLQVRYEDLVGDPARTLERVRAFAGLRADERWEREWRRLRFPDRNQRWRQVLDAQEQERVTAVQAPTLAALGYRD